jgi:hypothetical protein
MLAVLRLYLCCVVFTLAHLNKMREVQSILKRWQFSAFCEPRILNSHFSVCTFPKAPQLSRHSAVGIVTSYGLDARGLGVQ